MRGRRCGLQYAARRVEACPGEACPFWEAGGAALADGCVVERLAIDLERRPDVAHALVQIRCELDRARTAGDDAEARSLFYRLAPEREDD